MKRRNIFFLLLIIFLSIGVILLRKTPTSLKVIDQSKQNASTKRENSVERKIASNESPQDDELKLATEFVKILDKYKASFYYEDRFGRYYLSKDFVVEKASLQNIQQWKIVAKDKAKGKIRPLIISESQGGPVIPMRTLKIFLDDLQNGDKEIVENFIADNRNKIEKFDFRPEFKTFYVHSTDSYFMLELYHQCRESLRLYEKLTCAPEFYIENTPN
jgi:hypothetical protein